MRSFFKTLWTDTDGLILPYVTILLVVLMGMSALALDAGRLMTTQTQMQAIADALAMAGARELNHAEGAISRSDSAINNIVANGLTGLGYSGSITHSTTYYRNLFAANSSTMASPGTLTAQDSDAKFVRVTVNPVTIPTVLPIRFFQANATNDFTTGSQAIAGNQGTSACGISPMFICNPWEVQGMTDGQATAALNAALDPNDLNYNPIARRTAFAMNTASTSPGHFGWLQPTSSNCNGPNGAACMNQAIALDSASGLKKQCFNATSVYMATGNKVPVGGALNDRFDMYTAPQVNPSTDEAPAINVRKGYVAGSGGNWCKAQMGDYLVAQGANASTPSMASVPTSGTINLTTNGSTTATVSSTAGIVAGMSIASNGALGNSNLGITNQTVASVDSATQITLPKRATASGTDGVTFTWLTAPLPLDKQFTQLCTNGTCIEGNADWDCASYWQANHTTTPPSGCTSSNPSLSRYDIYQLENSQASNTPTQTPISDYSGYPRGTVANGETGQPMCAPANAASGASYNPDFEPRIIHLAMINCLAQQAAITNGNSGGPVPVARFAQFFMTQPYNSDGKQLLYGEIVGLVDSLKTITLFQMVQLYR
jgi:Flp pilus assembly protein TadG